MKRLTGRRDGRAYIIGCPDFALPKIVGLIIQQVVDRLAAIEDILGDEYELADVAPVRHGRWERRNMGLWDEDYAYVCSVCGEVWNLIDSTPEDNNMNYCPNCGALMDGKEE